MKHIRANFTPICIVIFSACIGYLFGNPIKGLVIGLSIVFGATILLRLFR